MISYALNLPNIFYGALTFAGGTSLHSNGLSDNLAKRTKQSGIYSREEIGITSKGLMLLDSLTNS